MKSYRKELWFNVPGRRGFVNITPAGRGVPARERHPGGAVPGQRHAHHGLGLHQRRRAAACTRTTSDWLEELAPHEPISRYHHNRTGEDNGDAHLKRQVMGREVVVAITDGALDFGPWEQIFYGEFDGAAAEAGAGERIHRGVTSGGFGARMSLRGAKRRSNLLLGTGRARGIASSGLRPSSQ